MNFAIKLALGVQNSVDAKRVIQALTADELKFNNPARLGSSGGQTNLVWKRLK